MAALIAIMALALQPMLAAAQDDPPDTGPYPTRAEEGLKRARFIQQFGYDPTAFDFDADAADAACTAGNMAACADLGAAFRWGEGRAMVRPLAEVLLRRACLAAEAKACASLSELLTHHSDPAIAAEAPDLRQRACRLGLPKGCEGFAPLAPAIIEARLADACKAGGQPACRSLAALLIAEPADEARLEAGRGALDGLCRAGDAAACALAADHWRKSDGPGEGYTTYAGLGCEAGDAGACEGLARQALAEGGAGREAAAAWYDKACTSDGSACTRARDLREEPQLAAACDAGEAEGCVGLATLLYSTRTPLLDRERGTALMVAACEGGTVTACRLAGEYVLYGETIPDAEAAGIKGAALLTRGCDAGDWLACTMLADGLMRGSPFPEDQDRAAELYLVQCDEGRAEACEGLRRMGHPAAPVELARGVMPPVLTAEEVAEAERAAEEERVRAASRRVRQCSVQTVIYEGIAYSDRTCVLVLRAIKGFTIPNIAQAPWQALLWRPEKLGGETVVYRAACGGALVAEGWVLTAAHCLKDGDGLYPVKENGYRIRLGVLRPNSAEGNSYPILEVHPHPDYRRDGLRFDPDAFNRYADRDPSASGRR
ncbi:MAG: trypsin-like serine protease [Sphingopyxis terrae]|nr:trypsin-like serine protease [Sphingopyxis terrae]